MAQQWIVLFDSLGMDTLLPLDDLRQDDMIAILSGEQPVGGWNTRVIMMVHRARANQQRRAEVWAYDTADDFTEPDMREMWQDAPQGMADLVRDKGTCLYRASRPKEVIV